MEAAAAVSPAAALDLAQDMLARGGGEGSRAVGGGGAMHIPL
jgi:hypothetical protein